LPSWARRLASNAGNRLPEPKSGGLGINRLKRFLRSSGGSLASRYFSLQNRLTSPDLFSQAIRHDVLSGYTQATFECHGRTAPRDGLIRPALYLDYRTYLPEDLLHLADRISMAHSLEMRVPFVDHELVDDLFPIPDRTRAAWGKPKQLLRRALRPRLPAAHFRAPKRGFVGPTAAWLRNELSHLLADELSPSRLDSLGFFDTTVVDRLRREHQRGEQNHEGVLWGLLCFLTWYRSYVETPVPSTR
jgi:asparagine synthase (glutamine-hydrolysing)